MSLRRLLLVFIQVAFALGLSIHSPADCSPHTVAPARIPHAAWATLEIVKRTGQPPPAQVGGRRFGNYGRGGEQKLPVRGAQGRRIDYQEWDIHPRQPGRNRGPERLVTGSDGRAWYSADHYCTFTEMRR